MNRISPPDSHHLAAAEGWLGLGDWREASGELEKIAPKLRKNPQVQEVQWEVCAKAGQWHEAVECARVCIETAPQQGWGWIHLAYALHELGQTEEAYNILQPVLERFPKSWLMRYNLACYECQLSNLDESMNWLEKACDLGDEKTIIAMALEDDDLEPLWDKISEV